MILDYIDYKTRLTDVLAQGDTRITADEYDEIMAIIHRVKADERLCHICYKPFKHDRPNKKVHSLTEDDECYWRYQAVKRKTSRAKRGH